MVNLELVNEKDKCCGCGLCAFKCPKHAIEMKEDEYGYIYPYIHKDKCINCGICKKVCSYTNGKQKTNFKNMAYAACSKSKEILKNTASGGVFTSIATSFIEKKGVVYGSVMEKQNGKFVVKHIRVDNKLDLKKIGGSKYIQSDISNIFIEIKEDIKNNKKVLFSGTPCQVSAIKTFLDNNKNLYTIDIICHGVPNNKMFNDYIKEIERKKNIEIDEFKFRDKNKGWGLNYSYRINNNVIIKSAFNSSFYQLFLDSKTYRENCYNCPYANENRVGDITIGDYWGIDQEHPDLVSENKLNVENGVSCVIINSEKGKEILDDFCDNILTFESKYNKIKKHNQQLNKPCKKNNDREKILEIYKNTGYNSVEKFYFINNMGKNMIKTILYYFSPKIKKIIKKGGKL